LLFENILPIIKGRPEAELAQYYYAYSYYYQQKYILSAHYFQTFYETYSRSEHAEESMFMHAYSLYQESPVPNLDQQSTVEAIDAMQRFMNRYPYSEHIDQAQQIINELQLKLEIKAFDNAKLYYDLENYKAALVAFDNFQNDFPDSHLNEENSFLIMKTQYKLASQSIRSLQKERFHTTIKYYENFVDKYPNSKFIREAEDIYQRSLDSIEKSAATNKILNSN
jgi:outer membrane protein assembly factor BamD